LVIVKESRFQDCPMTGPHLIYFADPMCSWCWGFSPVITAVTQRFDGMLPVRLILGGLRPGTTKPMDEAAKSSIREHWNHVHAASGQPFDLHFFERDGFVYDTEPAARAVVVVRRHGMEKALAYLNLVQRAFYAENKDVTDDEMLADLVSGVDIDRATFLRDFRSDKVKTETWDDFAITQRAGISGFPSLIAGIGRGTEYSAVSLGYQPEDRIIPPLEIWLQTYNAAVERVRV
jgi:putative protein-disulfide isomerase